MEPVSIAEMFLTTNLETYFKNTSDFSPCNAIILAYIVDTDRLHIWIDRAGEEGQKVQDRRLNFRCGGWNVNNYECECNGSLVELCNRSEWATHS